MRTEKSGGRPTPPPPELNPFYSGNAIWTSLWQGLGKRALRPIALEINPEVRTDVNRELVS